MTSHGMDRTDLGVLVVSLREQGRDPSQIPLVDSSSISVTRPASEARIKSKVRPGAEIPGVLALPVGGMPLPWAL